MAGAPSTSSGQAVGCIVSALRGWRRDPVWFLLNRNVLWAIPEAKPLVLRSGFFRQLDSKLVTFAIDGGRNKPKFISKMQLHENHVQCFLILCGRDGKIFTARVFSHVVHDFRLLAD